MEHWKQACEMFRYKSWTYAYETLCSLYVHIYIYIDYMYVGFVCVCIYIYIYIYNPTVYEQSISELPLIRDWHINR